MNYQKLYQDIMGLDRNIRMVTICDTDGKIMYSDHRPGVTNLLTPGESRKSLEMAVNAWKSRSQLAPKIGRGKYVLAEYEKIKRITMPFGGQTSCIRDHRTTVKPCQYYFGDHKLGLGSSKCVKGL